MTMSWTVSIDGMIHVVDKKFVSAEWVDIVNAVVTHPDHTVSSRNITALSYLQNCDNKHGQHYTNASNNQK